MEASRDFFFKSLNHMKTILPFLFLFKGRPHLCLFPPLHFPTVGGAGKYQSPLCLLCRIWALGLGLVTDGDKSSRSGKGSPYLHPTSGRN